MKLFGEDLGNRFIDLLEIKSNENPRLSHNITAVDIASCKNLSE